MKQIWKFPLPEANRSITLDMPKGAIIRAFQIQRVLEPAPKGFPTSMVGDASLTRKKIEIPTIWAEVETSDMGSGKPATEMRHFLLVGTGHQFEAKVNEELIYIGSAQLYDGAILLHLYEVIQK